MRREVNSVALLFFSLLLRTVCSFEGDIDPLHVNIDEKNAKKREIAIIGAGVAGVSTAHFIKEFMKVIPFIIFFNLK